MPRLSGKLRYKRALIYLGVTLAAVLIAEGVGLGIMALVGLRSILAQPAWVLYVALVVPGAALIGLLLGAWAARYLTRRLHHALEISRAWTRGNLSLRIADPVADDLGLLAEQLDLLVEHLEQNEQDLEELRERNTRLTDQVRALAVVEERNRLARELHDSVKQYLFSLDVTASAIRTRLEALVDAPEDLAEMVQEVETAAQHAQRETTRLIEDLRPGSLQERGLAAALNDYTLLFGAREHLLIYLKVQGNDALLPPSVAETLYRVAQEALHNVARHARATRVDVHLRCIPEQVALTVRDNGVGFDTSQVSRGLGLANMQERVLTAGGRLELESQVGAGTKVLAEVGLTQPSGAPKETPGQDRRRPSLTAENWAWLGQKLVVPVGQTWPWLPADQVHLRRPLVEPEAEPLRLEGTAGFLGLGRGYVLRAHQQRVPLARVRRSKWGYEWQSQGASWAVRRVRGLGSKMALTRNGQPLAAMQYQGRLADTWSEIVYDGRGYRLSYVKDQPWRVVLADEAGDELLDVDSSGVLQLTLYRALPLPLLVMAITRIVDERVATAVAGRAAVPVA